MFLCPINRAESEVSSVHVFGYGVHIFSHGAGLKTFSLWIIETAVVAQHNRVILQKRAEMVKNTYSAPFLVQIEPAESWLDGKARFM
jgi:hypothetical protein